MKIAGVRLRPNLKVPRGRQGRWFKLSCDCHLEEFDLLGGGLDIPACSGEYRK